MARRCSAPDQRLALDIVDEHFGPIVKRVAAALMSVDRSSLAEVVQRVKQSCGHSGAMVSHMPGVNVSQPIGATVVTKDEITSAMLVLLQHNCLQVLMPTDDELTQMLPALRLKYKILISAIIQRGRAQQVIHRARQVFGDVGATIVEVLLVHGRLKRGQIKEDVTAHILSQEAEARQASLAASEAAKVAKDDAHEAAAALAAAGGPGGADDMIKSEEDDGSGAAEAAALTAAAAASASVSASADSRALAAKAAVEREASTPAMVRERGLHIMATFESMVQRRYIAKVNPINLSKPEPPPDSGGGPKKGMDFSLSRSEAAAAADKGKGKGKGKGAANEGGVAGRSAAAAVAAAQSSKDAAINSGLNGAASGTMAAPPPAELHGALSVRKRRVPKREALEEESEGGDSALPVEMQLMLVQARQLEGAGEGGGGGGKGMAKGSGKGKRALGAMVKPELLEDEDEDGDESGGDGGGNRIGGSKRGRGGGRAGKPPPRKRLRGGKSGSGGRRSQSRGEGGLLDSDEDEDEALFEEGGGREDREGGEGGRGGGGGVGKGKGKGKGKHQLNHNNQQQQGPCAEDEIIWMVGHDQFHRDARHEVCLALVAEKFRNQIATAIIRVIIGLTAGAEQGRGQQTSRPVLAKDIHKGMLEERESILQRHKKSKSEPGAAGWEKYSFDVLQQWLTFLCRDDTGLLTRVSGTETAGELAQFMAETHSMIAFVQRKTLHSILEERYDPHSARICQVLLEKKYLEQQQIGDLAMIPQKEVRKKLYRLYRDKMVTFTEVPKRTDHNPATTFYAWRVDKPQAKRSVLDLMHRALLNVRLRRAHLYSTQRSLLENKDRVAGEVEIAKYNEVVRSLDRLDIAQIRLDESLQLFRDF